MAIKGSLKEASLPDVIQLLALGQKTGCLSLADRSNLGYVYFQDGRISYASIVNRRDRLGDMLLGSGKITKEQLDRAVAEQSADREHRLGEILVRMGAIDMADLDQYMRRQVEEAIYYLFTWTRGSFQFEVGVEPDQGGLFSINPETLLLEGARRIDEWSLIEKKVPSFDLVFYLDRERLEASDVELTDVQQTISHLVDGTRSVSDVVDETGLTEFDVGKALYGLITAGFAHRSRNTAKARESLAVEAKVDEHHNLGVAFYRTGMLEEAEREFRRVLDLNPKSRHAYFYLGLVEASQARWAEAADAFRRIVDLRSPPPTVLNNLAFAQLQLGWYADAERSYGDAAVKAPDDPRILTGWGVVALRLRRYDVAEERLDRARAAMDGGDPSEPWYWARSLTAAARGDGRGIPLLEEGLARYPRSAVLLNNLAVLLELDGELDRAEQALRRGIAVSAGLPQLSKNLGDILYRMGRFDDAWESYEQAIQLDPNLGDDVYFKLGNIAYKRLDHGRAAAMWERTLECNPDHQLARTNLDTMNALQG